MLKKLCVSVALSMLYIPSIGMSVQSRSAQTLLTWPEDSTLLVLERADSPFYIQDDFLVKPGNVMVINPGVKLIFNENTGLIVEGRLIATGRRESRITFTSESNNFKWKGIYLNNAEKTNKFQFCDIFYGKGQNMDVTGKNEFDTVGGGIAISSSSAIIEYCSIKENEANKGGAIFAQDSELYCRGNSIKKNSSIEGGALYSVFGKAVFINNRIEHNEASNIGGAVISFGSKLEFVRNRIVDNKAQVEGGIYQQGSSVEYKYNNISRNSGKEVKKELISAIIREVPYLLSKGELDNKELEVDAKIQEKDTGEQIVKELTKEDILELIKKIDTKFILPEEFSPYTIKESIVITPSGSLTIQPGVVLNMAKNTGIIVKGKLVARGEKTNKIYINSLDEKKPWNNITFWKSDRGNIIEYCVITGGLGRMMKVNGDAAFKGGGALAVVDSELKVSNSMFEVNTASYGGAIFAENADITIENNSFQKNKAQTDGGALFARLSFLSILNNDFLENESKHDGGAIYLYQSDPEITGNNIYRTDSQANKTVIMCHGSKPIIKNNQIHSEGRKIVVKPDNESRVKRTVIPVF
ncbi:MAG: hypothetical protein ABII27_03080 [bacterium]